MNKEAAAPTTSRSVSLQKRRRSRDKSTKSFIFRWFIDPHICVCIILLLLMLKTVLPVMQLVYNKGTCLATARSPRAPRPSTTGGIKMPFSVSFLDICIWITIKVVLHCHKPFIRILLWRRRKNPNASRTNHWIPNAWVVENRVNNQRCFFKKNTLKKICLEYAFKECCHQINDLGICAKWRNIHAKMNLNKLSITRMFRVWGQMHR